MARECRKFGILFYVEDVFCLRDTLHLAAMLKYHLSSSAEKDKMYASVTVRNEKPWNVLQLLYGIVICHFNFEKSIIY